MKITNPNPVGAHLRAFDYDFWLNNGSFIKGNQNQGLDIAANATSRVSIPLTLSFSKIYELYKSLKNQDEMDYRLQGGLNFDLPVLGATRIPYKTEGKLPVIKLPGIDLKSLRVKNLGLTSVTLEARFDLQNPNAFGLNLDRLKYALSINGQEWLSGLKSERIDLAQKGQTELNLPIKLNVLNMGTAALKLIRNGASVKYKLDAGALAGSNLELFKSQQISLEKTGQVSILK